MPSRCRFPAREGNLFLHACLCCVTQTGGVCLWRGGEGPFWNLFMTWSAGTKNLIRIFISEKFYTKLTMLKLQMFAFLCLFKILYFLLIISFQRSYYFNLLTLILELSSFVLVRTLTSACGNFLYSSQAYDLRRTCILILYNIFVWSPPLNLYLLQSSMNTTQPSPLTLPAIHSLRASTGSAVCAYPRCLTVVAAAAAGRSGSWVSGSRHVAAVYRRGVPARLEGAGRAAAGRRLGAFHRDDGCEDLPALRPGTSAASVATGSQRLVQ